MDYEKAYKELMDKLRCARNGELQDDRFRVVIDRVIPELAESEDEKIRKEISKFLKDIHNDSLENRRFIADRYGDAIPDDMIPTWLAWLEKQKPVELSKEDNENFAWFDKFFRAESVIANGRDIPQDKYQWFKSLKPQNHWKPSEEQLRDLKLIADQNAANMLGNNLINLYNDLQKLWL